MWDLTSCSPSCSYLLWCHWIACARTWGYTRSGLADKEVMPNEQKLKANCSYGKLVTLWQPTAVLFFGKCVTELWNLQTHGHVLCRPMQLNTTTWSHTGHRGRFSRIINLGARYRWSVAYRGGVWGVQHPPPPKFRSFDKAEPNSQFCGKYICKNLTRIRVSLLCKLSGTPD
jgi:hypothetical protein